MNPVTSIGDEQIKNNVCKIDCLRAFGEKSIGWKGNISKKNGPKGIRIGAISNNVVIKLSKRLKFGILSVVLSAGMNIAPIMNNHVNITIENV